MRQRFLVMGDNHGDTTALRRVLTGVAGETVDYVVHVGDFTNAVRDGRQRAAAQLRASEPILEQIADHARHGFVWVYGNRDHYGDIPADLDVGTRVPDDGSVTVEGQRFTNDPAVVDRETILVTHLEHWSLLDQFGGRAHLCGNTHRGRSKGRRLNAAFLQYADSETGDQSYGGYFVVEVTDSPPFDVTLQSFGGLERKCCPVHGERGDLFLPPDRACMYCANPVFLMREMAATSFYGVTEGEDDATVSITDLVAYAVSLWDEPPPEFAAEFRTYLETVEDDRYAPLSNAGDGVLEVAEPSYAY